MTLKLVENPTRSELFKFASLDEQYMSGLYKLVVQWVKCLLTSANSNPADPTYGTGFSGLISGNVTSPDFTDVVRFSIDSATEQIQNIQNTQNLDDSERLSTVSIINLQQKDTSLTVTVEITNVAGDSLLIVLPTNLGQ